ncbi:MAG: two-component system NarL family nitrate/nitrite response regulator NarL [Comamonadaceae bacterium]|nr:MAG: two-component system NarL family nitrate/nitrite response regulator NarL [Comamonadaceae bacterium]
MTSFDNSPIRILVVDDHTLFRRGLIALLARDASLLVVGDAADAGQAQRKAQELQPHVILLDNHLPGVNGVDALPSLREAAPHACILMLTVSEDENDLAAALHAGACAYLLKTMEGDDLTAAIHRAVQGDSIIAPEMMGKLISAYKKMALTSGTGKDTAQPACIIKASTPTEQAVASLSPRELDILRGIARGDSNKEIAREHGIVETTVKIHVQHVLRKLGVSSRVHAAVMATEHGLL